MTNSPISFRIPGGTLPVGTVPRVVGTLSALPPTLPPLLCDVAEIRLDQLLEVTNWVERGQAIEAQGIPVILTVRLHSEGGKWNGPDQERSALYQKALSSLSAVDVELRSNICHEVAAEAKAQGKLCIVSYHDFNHTPPLDLLEAVVTQAQEFASIVKVVTLTESREHEETLRQLLAKKWKTPLCVMGMGTLGPDTRVTFPALGSCLTYGYLDAPAAPGQMPAGEVAERLRLTLPIYAEDYQRRMEKTA